MHFHRLHGGIEQLSARVAEALKGLLAPRAHECIFVNFSKYQAGDFLASHTDTPSGSPSYERRKAFVWHLSEGWQEMDGGLFIDEETGRCITPSFNTLVTFAVPRRHAVSKVKRGQRLAAYGWVATPRVELLGSPEQLESWLPQGAVAVAFEAEPLQSNAAELIGRFTRLAMEPVGRYTLGELCCFGVTAEPAVARLLGMAGTDPAVAVLSRSGAVAQVCTGSALTELRSFVHCARKSFTPCQELALTNGLLMADVVFSQELKVFLFFSEAHRTVGVVAALDALAALFQPKLWLLLVEPSKAHSLLEDFGLGLTDVPTAVAEDTAGPLGRFWLRRRLEAGEEGLDLEPLRRWLEVLAGLVAG